MSCATAVLADKIESKNNKTHTFSISQNSRK